MRRVRGSREEHGDGWQGCGNSYIIRAHGLEANVAISYTIKGRRSSFKDVDIKVTPTLTHVAGGSMAPTTP
jgi:hypothetical protein